MTIPRMAVQFVLGRAGTGKTHHCFDMVEQWVARYALRSKVLLLVPRQATFIAERELVARNDGRSLLGVRVVSPESLVREVAPQLAETSELISGRGRRLLIALAIQQSAAELQYFRGAENQPHLAERIDAALAEFEQADADIADAATALASRGDATQAKLADLALIRSAYLKLLGDRLDSGRMQQQLLDAIAGSSLIAGSLVVVDGFADFSPIQRRMLVVMARTAAQVRISLLRDAAESLLFRRTDRTYACLRSDLIKAGVAVEPDLLLGDVRRFQNDELRIIENAFEPPRPVKPAEVGHVRIIEAASDLEEVRASAEQIKRWQGDGVRLRNIGVICRDLASLALWVRPVFAEYNIPSFIDQQRSLSEHPLVRYIRAALGVSIGGWRRGSVMELLKCGLAPLERDEADRLDNFALRHGIDREQWIARWDFLAPPLKEDQEPQDQSVLEENKVCSAYRDRLVDAVAPVAGMCQKDVVTAREFSSALRQFIGNDRVTAQLNGWMRESEEARQEHEQCVEEVNALLEACESLLGSAAWPVRQLAQMLLASMERMGVKLAPPTLDQVQVGQIDRSRSPAFSHVIVMGLNEGVFPAKATEDSLFSDAERAILESAGIEVAPDSRNRAMAEQFLAYVAFTRPSLELVLTRSRSDEAGKKQSPSGFLLRVQQLLPNIKAQTAVVTPKPNAETMRKLAQAYSNTPLLDPGVAASLLGGEMTCSATRLETFAQCPFKHFAQHSLRLRTRDVAEVSSLDLGNAFHEVLQRLAARMIEDRTDWTAADFEDRLKRYVTDVSAELRGQVLLSNERNKYLLGVIERMLLKLRRDQLLLSATGYRVADAELSFGDEDGLPALEISTPKGRTVRLRGRIDRVDTVTKNGRTSHLVFDYKTGDRKLNLAELEQGLSLQLMIYWLVLEASGQPVDGAFYQRLMRPMASGDRPDSESIEKRAATVSSKPRGLLRFEARNRLQEPTKGFSRLYSLFEANGEKIGREATTDAIGDADLESLREYVRAKIGELADSIFDGTIAIRPFKIGTRTPCPYCDYRAVCRFDPAAGKYNLIAPSLRTQVLDRINPARAIQEGK